MEELDLPSTPDTFEATRDLIAMTAPLSPALAPHRGAMLSKGKLATMQHQSPSPQHRFLAPTPFGTTVLTEVGFVFRV